MRRRAWQQRLVIAAVGVLVWVGAVLVQAWGSRGAGGHPQVIGRHPAVYTAGKPGGVQLYMMANMSGTLAYARLDDCFLRGERGGMVERVTDVPHAALIRWPYGTTGVSDHGRFGVRLPNGDVVLAGDSFEAGGGAVPFAGGGTVEGPCATADVAILNPGVTRAQSQPAPPSPGRAPHLSRR